MSPDSPTLRQYQVEGEAWLRHVGRGLLADPPRTGKTCQLLRASEGKTLVIAPPHLQGTWADEHEKWTPDLDLTFSGYQSVARRFENKQGRMLRTMPYPKIELRGPWDTVICDESHNLTNPKADWTGAVSRIPSERLFLATGTPIPHWASNLLVPLRLLYPGDKRFTNVRRWQKTWFKVWEPPWGGVQVGDLKDGIEWSDFWAGNGLDGPDGRMLQRDVDLGVPFTENHIEVTMTLPQARAYKQLKREYVTWCEDTGEEVSAWSDGGLHTKLHQLSTGLDVVAPPARGSGKLQVVRELMEASRGRPTLLFCQYRQTARCLEADCIDGGFSVGAIHGGVAQSDRDARRRAFQAGELDVLIGTLATVSEGLTFSRASSEIFVEHSWTPWRNDQAIKRAMEAGKTAHVDVTHLWTKDTIDAHMKPALAAKTAHQVEALTAREFRGLL